MTTLTTALLALSLAQAPQTLTLQQALQRADEVNLDLKAAQTRVTQAKANVWKAWSGHLLQIGAQGSYTFNDAKVTFPPYNPAAPADTKYFTIQPWEQTSAQVQATLPLIAPQAWFGIQAALRAEDATVLSVEQARRDVLFGVAQAYYAVASLKRLVDVSQQLQEIAERQAKDAEDPLQGRHHRQGGPAARRHRPRPRRAGPAPLQERLPVGQALAGHPARPAARLRGGVAPRAGAPGRRERPGGRGARPPARRQGGPDGGGGLPLAAPRHGHALPAHHRRLWPVHLSPIPPG